MSGDEDIACLGLCMDDPDSGICLGCGRRTRAAGEAEENGDGLRLGIAGATKTGEG